MKIIFSLIEFFNVKVSLFFDFFNPLVHIFWVLFGEWRYSVCVSLLFLDLSTGWKFVVSLTSPSLYPGGGCHRSLLGTRTGLEVLENRNMEPRYFHCSSCNLITLLTELSQLLA